MFLAGGLFPDAWKVGFICPIHKKGDPTEPNNYRGITVGVAVGKLFAKVLDARLTNWAETARVRATGQAGFRPDFRTADHVCTLQHLIDAAWAEKGGRLYCRFVEFQRAFDTVPRELLWRRLQSFGVPDCMLGMLKAMYAKVQACVRMV